MFFLRILVRACELHGRLGFRAMQSSPSCAKGRASGRVLSRFPGLVSLTLPRLRTLGAQGDS